MQNTRRQAPGFRDGGRDRPQHRATPRYLQVFDTAPGARRLLDERDRGGPLSAVVSEGS